MARITLYLGSFNPIHNGHTSVAEYVLGSGVCDELWFVVSPQNPLKDNRLLAPEQDRLRMAQIAVAEKLPDGRAKVCDVEFHMPRPSYTIDTLRTLNAKYPEHTFSLLMGADIMPVIDRWKDYGELLHDYRIYVYPRAGFSSGEYPVTYLEDAPQWDYSSTDIRNALEQGRDVSTMVAPGVMRYINEKGFWAPTDLVKLTTEIELHPTAALYIERGKFYNRTGQFNKALNDFLKAQELDPDNAEARTYITMLREMYAFRYVDYYNP